MAKKQKKHNKKSNLKKILIIIGASLLGVGVVTTAVVVPLVLNKKPGSVAPVDPSKKYSINIEAPVEYQSKEISMIATSVGFDYELKLKATVQPVIDEPNITWSVLKDNTPNQVIRVDKDGKVTLSHSIANTDLGKYSFTIKAALTSEPQYSSSISFNLDVLQDHEIPTTGADSWITYDTDNPNEISGFSDNWDNSKLNQYDTLTIPANVTRIQTGAFSAKTTGKSIKGCSIRLVFPYDTALTSIGTRAFSNCPGLVGPISIPDTVTTIEENAFRLDPNITGLLNPKGKFGQTNYYINRIGEVDCLTTSTTENWKGDFDEKTTVVGSIAFGQDLVIPGGIPEIAEKAFYNCSNITGNLVLPEGLQKINADAFNGCELITGDLTIPDSVTDIGAGAFKTCNFDTFANPIGKCKSNDYWVESLGGVKCLLTSKTTEWDGTFDSNTRVVGFIAFGSDLVIPDTITTIPNIEFTFMTGIKGTLTIPSCITNIGASAFQGCTHLSGTLVLPTSLTKILMGAFSDTGFDKIQCSFSAEPTLAITKAFMGMNSTGTVENTNPNYSSSALLEYLKTKGSLPSGWTAV